MDKVDKTKIELDKKVANKLLKLKDVGDTYSDVIKRLLDNQENKLKIK